MFEKDTQVRILRDGKYRDRVGSISKAVGDNEDRIPVKFGGRGRPTHFQEQELEVLGAVVAEAAQVF
jgi:hypothetical protein